MLFYVSKIPVKVASNSLDETVRGVKWGIFHKTTDGRQVFCTVIMYLLPILHLTPPFFSVVLKGLPGALLELTNHVAPSQKNIA